MRMRRCTPVVLLATAVLLGLSACSGNENDENVILPTSALFEITPPVDNVLVFLKPNPGDTSNADNLVILDVMLRDSAGTDYSHINLELNFNPGVLQVGQVDWATTPLGDCTASTPCAPLCLNNASAANGSGDLIIGVSRRGLLCPDATIVGGSEQKLMTLAFIGASVGTSPLTFVDGPGTGDCEILDAGQVSLGIPCDDRPPASGGAEVTVAR